MATVTQPGYLGNQVLLAAGQGATQTVTLNGLHEVGNGIPARSLILVINISAYTSGSLTVAVSGVTASAYTYSILTSAALAAAATTTMSMAPSLTTASNTVANVVIPASVQVVATYTGSLTYGIDYILGC